MNLSFILEYMRVHEVELRKRVAVCGSECPCRAACRRHSVAGYLDGMALVDETQLRHVWMRRLVLALPGGPRLWANLRWWLTRPRQRRAALEGNRFCPHDVQLYLENPHQLEQVFALLSDDLSRQIFLAILWQRLSFEYATMEQTGFVPDVPAYFIPEMPYCKDEVVVDCGAYTGDTFEEFLTRVGDVKRYYLYECDIANLGKLRETVMTSGKAAKAIIRPVGVYRENQTVCFNTGLGASSNVMSQADGGEETQVVKLDDDIPERDITVIKMDIEGAELDALRGAEDILRTCQPKLAICLYHNAVDFLTIPAFIHQACPEYTHFVIRQHARIAFIETVLYVW